ncbi:MAG: hypothetical protein J6T53_04595 [Bacteroidales bacterium]|nr:hypothetical protein [Bacteroidales bacterium]
MKNITMKALKLLILIVLVPLTSFAQNDAFFMTENDVFYVMPLGHLLLTHRVSVRRLLAADC